MNKKGFTLLELLAVIIVLSIIAVIVVPIVLNTINEAKKTAAKNNAALYLNAVTLAIANQNFEMDEGFEPAECKIKNNGDLLCDEKVSVEVKLLKGEKPNGGTITFKEEKIDNLELMYEGVPTITKIESGATGTKEQLVFSEGPLKYTGDNVVYFNVATGKRCEISEYNYKNSKTGYNGIDNQVEGQNSCLKFYIFEDTLDFDTVDLILDHNTTASIEWNSTGTFEGGPTTVLEQLKKDTANWDTADADVDFFHQDKVYTQTKDGETVTVNYEGSKARLITYEEIGEIVGNKNTSWSSYVLGGNDNTYPSTCKLGNTTGCAYGWLYDRTGTTCKSYGCLNNAESDIETSGYWTASVNLNGSKNHKSCNGNVSYGISHKGKIGFACVNNKTHYGVRPVITVSREQVGIPYKICTAVTESNKTTGNIPTGEFKDGDEYICEVKEGTKYHFFVVGKDKNKVNLILNRNINSDGTLMSYHYKPRTKAYSAVSWSENESSLDGPVTAMNFTTEATKYWVYIPNITENYVDEYISAEGNSRPDGGYGEFQITGNSRLPKYSEIFGETKCDFEDWSCPLWLINYMDKTNNNYTTLEGFTNSYTGNTYLRGYWLMSSVTDTYSWYVYYKGALKRGKVHDTNFYKGVRPVIEIPKENIS